MDKKKWERERVIEWSNVSKEVIEYEVSTKRIAQGGVSCKISVKRSVRDEKTELEYRMFEKNKGERVKQR